MEPLCANLHHCQAFRNIVSVSLFVGTGYPNFDAILKHVKREYAVVETICFNNENLA